MSEEQAPKEKKNGLNIKVILFGLPIFIIQLVLVYVITANILVEKIVEQKLHGGEIDSTAAEELLDPVDEEEEPEHEAVVGQFIFNMDDIVINPAGSKGQKFLLLGLGFDVPSEEILKEMETKQILVKDMILTDLSTKTIDEMMKPSFRDELKENIIESIKERFPELKVTTIYYSKYIIN